MSKAVLVMDMPESCFDCNLCHINGRDGEYNCQAFEVARQVNSETYEKPDWCPLRELSEYKRTVGTESENDKLLMNMGWNDCLEEIESII